MENQSLYQISLVASFIAGMVALFAPCCISYLFPAYIANVFRERRHILAMTFVYSLGIFVVMMPIVLGAQALSRLFFHLHDYTYIVGGFVMIGMAVLSFIGIKIPMPHLSLSRSGTGNDIVSTFTLGVFSGITSACCAPVLLGVLALSTLTPSTFLALGVGASFVLGMVAPLYVASLFIHKRNILEKPIFKRKVTTVLLAGRTYPVFVSNIVAAVVFSITGILMVVLASSGKLAMTGAEQAVTKQIHDVAFTITDLTGTTPLINLIFVGILGLSLYYFIKHMSRENKRSDCCHSKKLTP